MSNCNHDYKTWLCEDYAKCRKCGHMIESMQQACDMVVKLEAQVAEFDHMKSHCETMDQAEKWAIARAFKEACVLLGLDAETASPADMIEAIKEQVDG